MTTTPELVVGALVRWPAGPGEPMGIVLEVDGPRMRVRFDGDTEPKVSTLVRMSSSGSNCLEWSSERVQARLGCCRVRRPLPLLAGRSSSTANSSAMLTDTSMWSHARDNEVVPSPWQATVTTDSLVSLPEDTEIVICRDPDQRAHYDSRVLGDIRHRLNRRGSDLPDVRRLRFVRPHQPADYLGICCSTHLTLAGPRPFPVAAGSGQRYLRLMPSDRAVQDTPSLGSSLRTPSPTQRTVR